MGSACSLSRKEKELGRILAENLELLKKEIVPRLLALEKEIELLKQQQPSWKATALKTAVAVAAAGTVYSGGGPAITQISRIVGLI